MSIRFCFFVPDAKEENGEGSQGPFWSCSNGLSFVIQGNRNTGATRRSPRLAIQARFVNLNEHVFPRRFEAALCNASLLV